MLQPRIGAMWLSVLLPGILMALDDDDNCRSRKALKIEKEFEECLRM